MKSVWDKDYINNNIPSIKDNINTPILIIGGGIAGLMCAYNFMKNNIDFILVDSNKIGCGVSAKTTAQVSTAHDDLYYKIKNNFDEDKALEYYNSQNEGLNIIREIIKNENINCDYKEESTILYANEEENIDALNTQYNILKKDKNIKKLKYKDDIFKYKYAMEFKNQFIFNPMKYMMSILNILLKANAKLYEKSKVTKINKNENDYEVIINDKYKINTKKIIMACHYPFLNPDNLYFAKIYQSKSYVVAFESNIKINANYVSLDESYYYLRTYDNSTLLIGGCDHYTGMNTNTSDCYNKLIDKIKELDKDAKILYKWFTEDCMPIDSLPFVGKYSKNNPDIILITGFQKWGFTNSHIAAKNVLDMIKNDKYDDLYNPDRNTLLKDLKSTFRMIFHSLDGLIISKIFQKKYSINDIKVGSGRAFRYKSTNVLAYRKSNDEYIFFKNKCTHMGCSLIWNDVDKLWECKCHGSIFDKYGKVIYGPAIKDLEQIYF